MLSYSRFETTHRDVGAKPPAGGAGQSPYPNSFIYGNMISTGPIIILHKILQAKT